MRPQFLLTAILLAVAAAPYPAQPVEASCAAPALEVQGQVESPALLRRGEQVTVIGRGFVEGCDDMRAQAAFGCSGNDEVARETETPMTRIGLVLLQGQPTMKQTSLAVSDAGSAAEGRLGQVAWTFTVPPKQPLGRAVLKTVGSEPLAVRIVRR